MRTLTASVLAVALLAALAVVGSLPWSPAEAQTPSNDATLSALSVSPKDIIGFDADRTSYEVGVDSTVATATVSATATVTAATVVFNPTDAETGMTLSAGRNEVTITVTAEDANTTKEYTVSVNKGVTDAKGWQAGADLDGLIAADHIAPRGIWSDETTMWVVDSFDDKLFAYTLVGGARDSSRDITLATVNNAPKGIWSNDTTVWVVDSGDDKLYAYTLSSRTRDSASDITLVAANNDPSGIWSDGMTVWVTDADDDKLYAYTLEDGTRDAGRDFDTLAATGNDASTGIWSDETTMWVAGNQYDKVYAYNMPPPSDDATLSALSVSPKDIIGFDADGTLYEVGVDSTVATATVTATVNDLGATVVFNPADAETGMTLSAGRNEVTITVTAEDGSTQTYSVSVNRGVTDPKGWQAGADLDGLKAAGNTSSYGIWSNDTTMWVADAFDNKLYAYTLESGAREPTNDITLVSANGDAKGIWSNETTVWVADWQSVKLYAYTLEGGAREPTNDITLHANSDPGGIWSDDTTVWVADTTDAKLYAYTLESGTREPTYDITLAADNPNPRGIWSNGTTVWVVEDGIATRKLYAYTLESGTRDASRDFDTLSAAGNVFPRAIWSKNTTMWVADYGDDKVYAYKMPPPSNDATLSELSVESRVVYGIDQDQTAYQVGVGPDVETATVTAVTSDLGASWLVTSPADADPDTAGHQVALSAGGNSVTVQVTAEDGTTKDYTVSVNRGVTDAGGWQAGADLDGLIAAGNTSPKGMWSDGTTMWVAEFLHPSDDDDKLFAYTLEDGSRDAARDIDLHDDNTTPQGIWSNRTTMWVVDSAEGKLFAYKRVGGTREPTNDITLDADNDLPTGIWSNGVTVWVVDTSDDKVYAYALQGGARKADRDFNLVAANSFAFGVWSDDTTMWVEDNTSEKVFAYLLSDGSRNAARDINLERLALAPTSVNKDSRGIWSNGETMWVANDGLNSLKIFAYNLPPSNDATLSALSVSPKDIIGFDARRPSYEVGVDSTVPTATVTAITTDAGATVVFDPPAAETGMTLSAGRKEVTITVTAEDGNATKEYTVSVNRGVTDAGGWQAGADLDGLAAAGNNSPRGMWSNGRTVWVANSGQLFAYTLEDGTREPTNDITLADDNDTPRGIWSNGTTVWVVDESVTDKLYAYMLSGGVRETTNDITLHADNAIPYGIWSNGTTVWVADDQDNKLYAYTLEDGTRDSAQDITLGAGNGNPYGMWSNGTTIWVADVANLYAYTLEDRTRDDGRDFTLVAAGNDAPTGIWSDETTIWVADTIDDKVYAYNMVADDAAEMTVSYAASTYELREGSETEIIVVLSNDPESPLTIRLSTDNQSGTTVQDYSGVPPSVTFPIGQTRQRFTFTAVQDQDDENAEDVTLGFDSLPSGVSAGTPAQTTVTILDSLRVAFSSSRYEAYEGGTDAVVTVSFDSAVTQWTLIPLIASGNNGATSADWTGVPNHLNFAPRQRSETFTLVANVDNDDDAGESVLLGFRSLPAGVVAGTPRTATVELVSAEEVPQVCNNRANEFMVLDRVGTISQRNKTNVWRNVSLDPYKLYIFELIGAVHGSDILGDVDYAPGTLTLEDPNFIHILNDSGSGVISRPGHRFFVWGTTEPGPFKIEVGSENGGTGTYQIKVRVNNVCFFVDDEAVYKYDGGPDGYKLKFDEAADTSTDDEVRAPPEFQSTYAKQGFLGNHGGVEPDVDWFWVNLDSDYEYQVEVWTDTGYPVRDQATDLKILGIYDEDGDEIQGTYSSNSGKSVSVDFQPTTTGRYYISVGSEGNDHTGVYQIRVTGEATSAQAASTAANTPATGAPTIGGTAQVGETLTADTSGIADEDGMTQATFTYRWSRQDLASQVVTDITGATGSSYVLTADDSHNAISVSVSFTDDAGNDETLTSYRVLVLPPPNSPATGAPTISGTAQVGETLTAHTSGIADDDGLNNVAYGYQWLADDADIAGATATTYTLTASDEGAAIRVRVSFTDDAGHAETATSAATYAVAARPNSPATGKPAISGTANVGEALTASTSRIADQDGLSGATYGYQWLADGTDIAGATDSTYTLTDSEEGKIVQVRVSFTDDAGHEEELTSVATEAVTFAVEQQTVNTPATGQPTISGTVQVGETLTASTSRIADQDGLNSVAYQYRWLADGTDIAGASGSSYTLTDSEEGTTVQVQVSFTDDAGHDETATSAATATVEGRPNRPATGQPAISGTLQVGETLTASTSGIADQDGLSSVAYRYQWLADGTDIAGVTATTYTLQATDEGAVIKVRVSFTDDEGHEEELTSKATKPVALPLTGSLHDEPESHDGLSEFTFELRFSENVRLSYKKLRDHAFTVTGGTVQNAQRIVKSSNIRWLITVAPDSDSAVHILLPETTRCGSPAGICAIGGRKFSSPLELTVNGP